MSTSTLTTKLHGTGDLLHREAADRIEELEGTLEALVQESLAVVEGELDDHTTEVVDAAIAVLDK